jgi:hypothetical protein
MSTGAAIEQRVRESFATQARICARLGSPFTALLCSTLGSRLSRTTPFGSAVLAWDRDPGIYGDNLPLRVAGALHALVRSGRAPGLQALYPPQARELPEAAQLAQEVDAACLRQAPAMILFIRRPLQTNEVGRSSLLIGGLLELARRYSRPIVLYELGASAGLNLIADRYRHVFGSGEWGPPGGQPRLAPEWSGPDPPVATRLHIMQRGGCDLSPVDLSAPEERERLAAYVWPDQFERLARLSAAIETAAAAPPAIERSDALRWLEQQLGDTHPPQALLVVWHSLVWNYFDVRLRARIEAALESAGGALGAGQPLAWLRYELDSADDDRQASLRLSLWPKRENFVLAEGHPHGSRVHWRGLPAR